MTNFLIKNAIGIASILGIIFICPLVADASGLSVSGGSDGVVTATITAPQNSVSWFNSAGGFLGTYTGSSININLGASTTGQTVDFAFFDMNNIDHVSYCGIAAVTANSIWSKCTSESQNSFISGGQGVTWVYTYSPSQSGFQAMIGNASSTFTQALGFGWSGVVGFMGGLLLNVLGAGLGVLQSLLKYIIALLTIFWIVYFIYRAFKFFKH